MDEGDPGSSPADTRRFVDQLRASCPEMRKGGVDVEDGISNMMQAFAPLLKKTSDRGIGVDRLKQLDKAATDRKQGLFHPLAFDHFPVQRLDPVLVAIGRDRRFEIADGDADVIEVVDQHEAKARWRLSSLESPWLNRLNGTLVSISSG